MSLTVTRPCTLILALVTTFATLMGAAPARALPRQCHDLFSPKSSERSSQAARTKAWLVRSKDIESSVLVPRKGEVFSYQFIAPESAERPVLLLLPGSNRGLTLDLEALQLLGLEGYGLASMNFSTQPQSVASLAPQVKPRFAATTFQLQDLAEEVEFYAESLRARGYRNIVPVSLSYSGAVSPFLKSFPFIIETSPMTATSAANPDLKKFMDLLDVGSFFNPLFGPSINRALLDQAYTKTWTQQVDTMISNFHLPTERKNEMIAGYLAMSRAAEGFSWKKQQSEIAKSSVEREFILAGSESPSLMLNQLESFRSFAKSHSGGAKLSIIIGAGHLILNDQPRLYVRAMIDALKNGAIDRSIDERPESGKKYPGIEISIYQTGPNSLDISSSVLKDVKALEWLDQMIKTLSVH